MATLVRKTLGEAVPEYGTDTKSQYGSDSQPDYGGDDAAMMAKPGLSAKERRAMFAREKS